MRMDIRLLHIYSRKPPPVPAARDACPNNILTHRRADVNARAGGKVEEFRGKAGQKRGGARIYFLHVHRGEGRAVKRFHLHIAFTALSARLDAGSCASEGLSVAAKGAVLIDAKSGRVLFGQNENERFPMASTTKIMTALLALENCALDEEGDGLRKRQRRAGHVHLSGRGRDTDHGGDALRPVCFAAATTPPSPSPSTWPEAWRISRRG